MGKPLITDGQMLAMHRVMSHLRESEKAGSIGTASATEAVLPIAVLAAVLLQMRVDDVLVTGRGHAGVQRTLSLAQATSFHADVLPFRVESAESASTAALAAGYALAQGHYSHPGDSAPITVALLHSGAALHEGMRLAAEHILPLLLVVHDSAGVSRHAVRSMPNVEVIGVDANDAVAICRVMQESVLRARNRWGSVVIRALALPGAPDPLSALGAHLHRRGLA